MIEKIEEYTFKYNLSEIFKEMYEKLKNIVSSKEITESEKYRLVKSVSGFYGAKITALKKAQVSDFIVFVLLEISRSRGQDFSYHTAQNLIERLLNKKIDDRKVLLVFSNVEAVEAENSTYKLKKKKEKRTAKDKIEIEYDDLVDVYAEVVKAKVKLFDEIFTSKRKIYKEKFKAILTDSEAEKVKLYSTVEKKILKSD